MFQDKYLTLLTVSILFMSSHVASAECLSTLNPATPEESALIERVRQDLKPSNGNLDGANFPLRDGAGTLKLVSQNGTPVIQITSLPDSAVDQIAQGAGFPANDMVGMAMIRTFLGTGGFQFNASICEQGSDYVVNLTGIDQAFGTSGEFTLSPTSNGFSVEGNLAGQRVEKGHYVAQ